MGSVPVNGFALCHSISFSQYSWFAPSQRIPSTILFGETITKWNQITGLATLQSSLKEILTERFGAQKNKLTQCQTQILLHLHLKCNQLKRKSWEIIDVCKMKSKIVKLPVVHGMYNALQCRTKRQFEAQWHFSLDQRLRLNITFKHLFIEKFKGDSGRYFRQNSVEIVQGKRFMMILGKLAGFSLYTSVPNVGFSVKLVYAWRTVFHIEFGVISKGQIVSQTTQHRKHDIVDDFIEFEKELIHSHNIIDQKQVLTYKISVNSYETIILNLMGKQGTYFLCFDGPGFLSSKTEVYAFQAAIEFHSFQCVVQVITFADNTSTSQIDYDGKLIHRCNSDLSLKGQNFYLNVTDTKCLLTPCVHTLTSPQKTVVNVTITQFGHSAPPDESCSWGGLAFFEDTFFNGSLVAFKWFCNRSPGTLSFYNFPRSIFSKSNNLILSVYSYEEYSSLDVKLEISHMLCAVVRICGCKEKGHIQKINLNSDLCYLIQVSSGMYDPLWLKSNWKNYNIQLPIAQFFVHIFQNAKKRHIGHYRIFGFREGNQGNNDFVVHLQLSQAEFEYTEFQGNYWYRGLSQRKHGKLLQPYHIDKYLRRFDSSQNIGFLFKYSLRTETVDFKVGINYWLHSWVNILITPSDGRNVESSLEMPLTFEKDPHLFTMRAFVPVTRSRNKFLVLRYVEKPNITSASVDFRLSSQASNWHFLEDAAGQIVSDVFPLRRLWIFGLNVLSRRSPQSEFAFPGLVQKVILDLCSLMRRTNIVVRWIKVRKVTNQHNYRQPVFGQLTELKLHNYHVTCDSKPNPTKIFSWQESQKHCWKFNSSLPQFFSRVQHEELLYLIKTAVHFVILEGIFIALTTNNSKMRQ